MKNTLLRAGLTLGLALAASLFTSGTAKAQYLIFQCNGWNYPSYFQSDCGTYNDCVEDNICETCGDDASCQDSNYDYYEDSVCWSYCCS